MKKKVFGRKLSRNRKSRKALFRSLVRALAIHGKITTTKSKSKAIQVLCEKIVNIAKKNDLTARRRVFAILGNDKETTKLIFDKIVPAMSSRKSGYTRIIGFPPRRGDLAQMARIEWVENIEKLVKTDEDKGKAKTSQKKEIIKRPLLRRKSKAKTVEKKEKKKISKRT